MRGYALTPLAQSDLEEIWNYVREQASIAQADRVARGLERALKKLSSFPHIGHVRPDLTGRPLRFWPVYSYLICYDAESKPLRVVRILSARRDFSKLL